MASSVRNAISGWSASESATQCTFTVARVRYPTTGAMSAGSVSSDQSRSASHGDTSDTT